MKKVGFALLLAAVSISVIMTSIFGSRFWVELSSWLMIVVGLGVVGLALIGIASIARATGGDEDPHTEPTLPA